MKNYFEDSELRCKCCGILNVDETAFAMLNKAREIADVPFVINSACRCEKHNLKVGGSITSSHIATPNKKCTAFDIKANTSGKRFHILEGLIQAGFKRIGIDKDFIHADNDLDKQGFLTWVYN